MKSLFQRSMSMLLAVVMLVLMVPTTLAVSSSAESMSKDEQWAHIQSLIAEFADENTWTTTAYEGAVTKTMPKTALLGNGNVGVTSNGDASSKNYYLSSTDFWSDNATAWQQYWHCIVAGGGVKVEAYDRETGAAVATTNNEFLEEQDIVRAEIRTSMYMGSAKVQLVNWLSAEKNIMITAVTSQSDANQTMRVQTWGNDSQQSLLPTDAGTGTLADGREYAWATRKSNTTAQQGQEARWMSEFAIAATVIGAEQAQYSADKTGSIVFDLPAGKTVYVVTAVECAENQTVDAKTGAEGLAVTDAAALLGTIGSEQDIEELHQTHLQWWKDYYLLSWVDLGDPELNRLYYNSQYIFGSGTREGSQASGLYGVWITSDLSRWCGDYHLNYNFQGPFYGSYSSNRMQEFSDPMFDVMLDWIDTAVASAADPELLKECTIDWYWNTRKDEPAFQNGFEDSMILRIGQAPQYGTDYDTDTFGSFYLNQTGCTLFCAIQMVSYYQYTQDYEWLTTERQTASGNWYSPYDFIAKTANFYTYWVEKRGSRVDDVFVKDNPSGKDEPQALPTAYSANYYKYPEYEESMGDDYVYVLFDAAHEKSYEFNPGVVLGNLQYVTDLLKELGSDTAVACGYTTERYNAWADIADHLVDPSVAMYYDEEYDQVMFGLSEDRMFRKRSATVELEWIHPAYQMGFNGDPEVMEAARNTITIMGDSFNGYSGTNTVPKVYAQAARCGLDAETIIARLKTYCVDKMCNNGHIYDGAHGWEKAGVVDALNTMMVMTDDDIMKVFPVWTGADAQFQAIRQPGAFLVSSEMKSGKVQYVDVTSEVGGQLKLVIPWDVDQYDYELVDLATGSVVPCAQAITENSEDYYLIADTQAGHTYRLRSTKLSETATPKVPVNLTAEAVSHTQLKASWEKNPKEGEAVTYLVTVTDELGEKKTVESSDTSVTIDGLTAAETYTVSVQAVYPGDRLSVDSDSATVKLPPEAADKPVVISLLGTPDKVVAALGTEASALQLPATVKARVYSSQNGYQEADVPVSWELTTFDKTKKEEQEVTGTLGDSYGNPDNLQAEITVLLADLKLEAVGAATTYNQLLDLTALGNADWVQVDGTMSGPSYIRKNAEESLISDLTIVDGKKHNAGLYTHWNSAYPIRTSWTDGTPTTARTDPESASGSGKGSAQAVRGKDSVVSFTVEAKEQEQTLTMSLGVWQAEATLKMWFESDPSKVETLVIDYNDDKIAGLDTASAAHYNTLGAKVISVDFSSSKPDDKLVVQYTLTQDYAADNNPMMIIQAIALYDETIVDEGGDDDDDDTTATGIISATEETPDGTTNLDLTALGTTDWVQVDANGRAPSIIRKENGNVISDLTFTKGSSGYQYGSWNGYAPYTTSWTDGTPTQSREASTTRNALGIYGSNGYVEFTVPAKDYEQTLTLSLGAFACTCKLETWLESDPDNKTTNTVSSTDLVPNATHQHKTNLGAKVITVKFSSTAENDKLVVRYTTETANQQGLIQAIALSGEAPAPENTIAVTESVPNAGEVLNLTELGPTDWMQFDGKSASAYSLIRKNGGSAISDLSFVDGTHGQQFGNWNANMHYYTTWTDGTPTETRESGTRNALGIQGANGSVSFTAPAKDYEQTLTLSLGAFNTVGTTCDLKMWFASDPENVITKTVSSETDRVPNAANHPETLGAKIFTVKFSSDVANDKLVVQYNTPNTLNQQAVIQAIALNDPNVVVTPPLDTTPIDDAIENAENAMKNVEVIEDKDPDEVKKDTKYTTQVAMDALNSAIIAAETAKENAASSEDVTNAVNALNTAIETFNDSVKTGTYYSVTSVTLNKTVFYLSVGDSETLQATVAPPNATNKNLTWESSNESIVTVDQDGKVTAVSNGVATIVVTTADNVKIFATCIVSIKQPVVSVTLDKTAETVENGKTLQLTATVNPDNADDKTVTWSSSNEDVATVDEDGLVTAVAKGEATITVTTTDGGKTATCKVTVTVDTSAIDSAIDVANGAKVGVEVNDSAEKVDAGKKFVTETEMAALTDAIAAANTAKENAKTSADVTNAVDALNAAVTTFTNAMKTGTYVAATGISLNKEVLELSVGKSETLVVNITPAEATIKTVTWETSDDKVVTVDQNGKVKAVGKGVANVTVTLTDANGNKTTLSAVCAVDIKLDVSALQTAIDNATTAMNSVSVIDDKAENEVTKDTKFVTTEVKEALESAITAAKAAKEAAKTNEDVTSAISALTSAVNTFNSATKTGTYVAVTGISLNKSEVTLAAGSTDTLQAIIAPADATNQRVTWTSSDDKVVTVANGLVTAVGKGEATITVTTVDGNKSASCKFTVTLDTSAISSAIDAADAAKSGVKIIDDKTIGQVTTGTKFVTTAEMKALTDAIATAKEAKESAKTKADVTNAVNALNTAVDTFKQAIKIGIDVSAIDAALTAAEAAKSGVDVSDKSADQVTKGTKFVTTAEMKALNDAITAAKGAKAQVTSAEEVTNVANALNTAVDTFKQAVKTGTYEEKVETKVQITEGGIKEVPESLKKAGLETPEKVKEALVKAIIKANGTVEEANIAHYDVTFMYSDDDGKTWVKADESHFPKDGKLQITLPYPKGTDKTYTFTVVHMFTSAAFGKTPGDVEMPKVTNGADGISFAVTGLSPITVSWTAPEAPEHDCEDSGHKLTKVDAKAATTEAEGNIEHYICSECGKYFSDAAGKTEIKKESVVIPKLTVEDETKPTDPTEKPEESKPTEPEATAPTEKPEESKPTDPKDPTEATKPESDTPDTGDHSNMALFITMMLISLAAVAFILLWDKRSFNGKYFK